MNWYEGGGKEGKKKRREKEKGKEDSKIKYLEKNWWMSMNWG